MSGFAKEMARMAFKIYDTNHDGFLDITEFIAAKALKGVGEDDAIAEFGLIDDNGDGRLSQAEYVQYMLDDTISDLRKAFVDMDVNGDGHVDREEFVMALVANGKPRKAAMTSCEACFSVADKERVGHISLEQFLAFARSNLDSVMPSNAVIEDVTNDESESAKKHVIARHQATQRSGPRHSKRGRAPPASAQRAAARRSVAPIAEEGGAMEMADQSSSLVDRKASADATEAPSTTDTAMAAAANPSTDTIGEESMEEAYAVTPAQLSNPAAPGAPRASAPEIHPLVRPPPPPSLPPPRTNKMEPPYFKRMREIIDAITAKGATVAQLEDSVADLWELAQAEKSRYAAVLTGVCLAAGIPEKRVDSAVNTWSISSLDDSKHPTPVFGTVKKTIHEEAAAAEAAYLSAICVNEGYGIDRNPKMAAALLKLAGKLGQKDSFFHIAQKHADEGVAAALMASSLKKGSFLAARAIFNVPDNEQIKPALFQKVISRHSPGMTALYKDAERICNAANRQSSRPFLDSDLLESILDCAGSNAKGGGGCCVIA